MLPPKIDTEGNDNGMDISASATKHGMEYMSPKDRPRKVIKTNPVPGTTTSLDQSFNEIQREIKERFHALSKTNKKKPITKKKVIRKKKKGTLTDSVSTQTSPGLILRSLYYSPVP